MTENTIIKTITDMIEEFGGSGEPKTIIEALNILSDTIREALSELRAQRDGEGAAQEAQE